MTKLAYDALQDGDLGLNIGPLSAVGVELFASTKTVAIYAMEIRFVET